MKCCILTLAIAVAAAAADISYCFGLLEAVPGRKELAPEEAQRIQNAHIGHLNALAENGWLVAAGPVVTPGALRGFAISKCQSVEEAKERHNADPAVVNQRLTFEAFRWRAPEGIGDRYFAEKAKDPNFQGKMRKHPVAFLMRGPKWTGMPPAEDVKSHLAYIQRMRKEGKMLAAGPFENGGDRFGIFVFAPMPLEEAKLLAENEPFAKAGLGRIEMVEWLTLDITFPQ